MREQLIDPCAIVPHLPYVQLEVVVSCLAGPPWEEILVGTWAQPACADLAALTSCIPGSSA